jgi:23S rRNA pseudouridine1911/1915/1917 synthase
MEYPQILRMDGISPNFNDTWRGLGAPIGQPFAGWRVDVYLSRHYPFLTRNGWQKRMDEGQVLINRRPVKSNYKLKLMDVLHFYHPEMEEPEADTNIKVLWKSGAVMAVFKPGNLPMHENGAYRKHTFAHVLSSLEGDEWSAVHRLDRETSGIVLCGANHQVRQRLADDFESKKIRKEYQLIVSGAPSANNWTVDAPLGDLTESRIRIKKWVVEGGLPSETEFVVEDRKESKDGPKALLRAFPKTGRTNQIRIHAAYSGHWIIGDKLYHPDEDVFLDYWEARSTTPFCVEQTGFHRCLLHAAALEFSHPETGTPCRIEAPMADDMRNFWRDLGP